MRASDDQSSEPAIAVEGLVKRYGGRAVVNGLTFTVAPGEVFALLGPNGAGKTTTIEILEGYRRRDGGDVRVLGLDPARNGNRLRRQIGLMLQEGGVYPQVRPLEILRLFAAFYDQPDDPARLLSVVGLADAVATSYRRLSGGQKQRLALALALIGRPRLVFLDEPTAGLDPEARRLTWATIRALKSNGVTVVLTTHRLDEAEALADRSAIINHGRLVALGDVVALRGHATPAVRVVATEPLPTSTLADLPSVDSIQLVAPTIAVLHSGSPALVLAEVTAWAVMAGIELRELQVGGETLEEVYLRLTGRDEAAP